MSLDLYHYGFDRTLALLYDMQLYTLHLQEYLCCSHRGTTHYIDSEMNATFDIMRG